jgi:hypothetical protein
VGKIARVPCQLLFEKAVGQVKALEVRSVPQGYWLRGVLTSWLASGR